jgi:pilus assembly protein CpaB
MLLAYSNRPIDTNTTYTTGGDVSRFQRRSVPGRAPAAGEQMASAMAGLGKGIAQAIGGPAAAPTGPVVRVARGNDVTVVPVGAR